MKKKIIPCVCIDHAPDSGDSGTYGMPTLQMYDCRRPDGFAQIIPKCPNCGRGGMFSFNTAHSALKHWNELQKQLWVQECTDFSSGELLADIEPWKKTIYAEYIENSNLKKEGEAIHD